MASDYQDQPHLPVEYQAWMLTHHTERVPGLQRVWLSNTQRSCSLSTQLCLSVAVQVAMATNSTVVVVDSSGAFSSLRLEEMLLGKGGGEEVRG